jgi:hypothetical protein
LKNLFGLIKLVSGMLLARMASNFKMLISKTVLLVHLCMQSYNYDLIINKKLECCCFLIYAYDLLFYLYER